MAVPKFGQLISWIAGGTQAHCPDMECGDEFLVAIRVKSISSTNPREWWEFQVITATENGFSVEGHGWGWDWSDVEWYIPVSQFECPVPKIEEVT